MSRAYNFCNNCGKTGHAFHQCKTNYRIGIIAYKETEQGRFFVECRKDTLGFVDFMRGKYHLHDSSYIKNIIGEMTAAECEKILTSRLKICGRVYGETILVFSTVEKSVFQETINN